MVHFRQLLLIASTLLLAVVAPAHADGSAAPAQDLVTRPAVLPVGSVEVVGNVEGWLLPGHVLQAVSLAPDVYVGVTRRLTLGVITSNRALARLAAGSGVCFGSERSGCLARVSNIGVDAKFSLGRKSWTLAPHGRLVMRQFSPQKPALMLGALLGWQFGRWAVVADPYVQLGLLNQDRGNRNSVHVPVWLRVQPTCRWQVALRTGFDSDFAVLRDGWHGALGGVVTAAVRPDVDLELSGGVRSAFGPQNTVKERSVALALIFRR